MSNDTEQAIAALREAMPRATISPREHGVVVAQVDSVQVQVRREPLRGRWVADAWLDASVLRRGRMAPPGTFGDTPAEALLAMREWVTPRAEKAVAVYRWYAESNDDVRVSRAFGLTPVPGPCDQGVISTNADAA